jgi:hypothetical protein
MALRDSPQVVMAVLAASERSVAISSMLTSAVDSVGTSAVRSIRTHTAESHAAALTLVEELLAIGLR